MYFLSNFRIAYFFDLLHPHLSGKRAEIGSKKFKLEKMREGIPKSPYCVTANVYVLSVKKALSYSVLDLFSQKILVRQYLFLFN